MFNLNLSDESTRTLIGKIKYNEISIAVKQAYSQVKREREAKDELVLAEMAKAATAGTAENDLLNAEMEDTSRHNQEHQNQVLRDMGAQPAVTLGQRCAFIQALDEAYDQVRGDFSSYPLADSIAFAIDNMNQGGPRKDELAAEILLAEMAGAPTTEEQVRRAIKERDRPSFDKYKTNMAAVRAEIVTLVYDLALTSDETDVEAAFNGLPDTYRYNLVNRALMILTDLRDQNLGIGRWRGIGKGKKKDGLNWKLYAPALERVAEVTLLNSDMAKLEGWLKQHADLDPAPLTEGSAA